METEDQDYGRFAEVLGPTTRNRIMEWFLAAPIDMSFSLRTILEAFPNDEDAEVVGVLEDLFEKGILSRTHPSTGYQYIFNMDSKDAQLLNRMYEDCLWFNAQNVTKENKVIF